MYHDCDGVQLQSFAFEVNFELGDNPIMEWFCNRLYCIWCCGLECILPVVYVQGQ